jgi:predicted nucleic acid-binding protein
MEVKYLLDTNTIIDYLANKLPQDFINPFFNNIINLKPNISIITQIELLGFNAEKEVEILLHEFVNDCHIISLSNDIVMETISLRKNHKIKIPDAIIAATSLINNYILITRNLNDFNKIDAVKSLNPYKHNS